ncbi:polynucleotide kinase 3 phosphatase-domain-containing protein [Lipomyces oligophaga]|uniref:polynucleotide kinase 3 phosphatase-domain-containing protein n=1 Tax=Lipomyces oligophaga TaxID=45792 RepID=UPI0034CF03E0
MTIKSRKQLVTLSQAIAFPETRIKWRTQDNSVLYGIYQPSPIVPVLDDFGKNVKFAIGGFDLDHTVILPKSGNRFARDEKDWKFQFGKERTRQKMQNYLVNYNKLASPELEDGCISDPIATCVPILVIFSNQGGIVLDLKKKPKPAKLSRYQQFQIKLEAVCRQINLPMYIIASTKKDEYRKPSTGMFNLVSELFCNQYKLSKDQSRRLLFSNSNSFYVGDAEDASVNHSDDDSQFARAIGVKFMNPGNFFLSHDDRTATFAPEIKEIAEIV